MFCYQVHFLQFSLEVMSQEIRTTLVRKVEYGVSRRQKYYYFLK
jgi:hypothetical protein